MIKQIVIFIGAAFLTSCAMHNAFKQHAGPIPSNEGCGHCHNLIYKDWKITYKPYEQVPVPGSTIAPGQFPQYHDRKEKEPRPGTTVMPARKDCGGCHVNAETPEGNCIRETSGFK